nr:nac transcription factor 32 [Quercus suber]
MESNHNHQQNKADYMMANHNQQNNKPSLMAPGITNQVMISNINPATQSLQALNVPRSNTISTYSSPPSVVIDPPEPDLDDEEEQEEEPNQQSEEVDELGLERIPTNNTNYLSRKRERYTNLSSLFCPQREQAINNLVQLQARRDADRKFPPGIRFRPTDLELILFYLYFKIKDNRVPWWNRIAEVELYNHSPKFLAEQFPQYGNNVWYFFTSRERKYPNGSRPKRTTNSGYWKATGVDKEIRENGILKGLKKTLVFYKGEPQHGDKTKWIMQEYRLVDAPIPTKRSPNDMKLDDCVLCKIYSTNNRKSSEQDEDHPEVVSDINPTTQLPQVPNIEIISPGLSLQGREAIMNDLCKLEEEQLKEQNPPGFRFDPTDRELVKYYLKPRVLNKPLPELSFMEVDLYNQNPDTLAEQNIDYGEKVWYFFTPRNRKYQNGSRPNRAAGDGYWKASGADVQIKEKGVIIGLKKTLNFMRGKPLKGEKTGWIMHEYKINAPAPTKRSENDMRLDDCVLCRIYNKKDRICNEDEDHSKDAGSISLPEDDRRELMENFNGVGQDYENLSNNNVPAPLANNTTSFPYQNKVRTAPPGFPLNLIVQRAYEALLEYWTAQPRHTMAAPTARQRARWSPPSPDWLKADFDVAIFEDVGRAEDSVESNHHQNKPRIMGSSSAEHIKNSDKSSFSSPPSKVQVNDIDIAEEEEQPHKEEPAGEEKVDDELNSLIKLLKDLDWKPHKKILNRDLPAPNLITEVELSVHSPESLTEDSAESNHHQNKPRIMGSSSAEHIKNSDKSSSSSPQSKVQVNDIDIAEEEEQPHKEEPAAEHIKNSDKSSSSSPQSKVQVNDIDIAEEEEQPHKEEPAGEEKVDDELNSLIKLLKDLDWKPHKDSIPVVPVFGLYWPVV